MPAAWCGRLRGAHYLLLHLQAALFSIGSHPGLFLGLPLILGFSVGLPPGRPCCSSSLLCYRRRDLGYSG